MGTAAYEAAYHVEQARVRGGIPVTDARFGTTRMLALLTAEMQGAIAPLIHAAKSEHGILAYTVPTVANQSRYNLPPSAFASTLRDVYWIDADDAAHPVQQISAADPRVYTLRSAPPAVPAYFVLQGSVVALYPAPNAAGTLALPHYARPSTLVPLASTLEIVAVDVGSSSVTLTVNYDGDQPFTYLRERLAVVSATPGFESRIVNGLNFNPGPDGIGTFLFEFLNEDVVGGTPQVGDYLCLPGESPVPQIPVELFPLLHARVAYVAVPSTGDTSQAANALATQVAELTQRAVDFLRPRVESMAPQIGRGGFDYNPMTRGIV